MVIPAGVAHERYVQSYPILRQCPILMLCSHTWLVAYREKSVNGMSLYIDPLFAQTVVVHRCMHAKHCAAQHAAILNVAERPCQAKQE